MSVGRKSSQVDFDWLLQHFSEFAGGKLWALDESSRLYTSSDPAHMRLTSKKAELEVWQGVRASVIQLDLTKIFVLNDGDLVLLMSVEQEGFFLTRPGYGWTLEEVLGSVIKKQRESEDS